MFSSTLRKLVEASQDLLGFSKIMPRISLVLKVQFGRSTACNVTAASCELIRQKMPIGQAEQDLNLPHSASNVLGRVLAV